MMYNVFSELNEDTRNDLVALEIQLYIKEILEGFNYRFILNSFYNSDICIKDRDGITDLKNDAALDYFNENIAPRLTNVDNDCIVEAFDLATITEGDFSLKDVLEKALHYIDNSFTYESSEFVLGME